jgi:Zn finger protein HypA/HybF involved in hydrogenase expression
MADKNRYYEMLKHPKWQKKRLEILQRANFECEDCGTNEVMLHVHHAYYEKGLAPWEYPDESLHCLCENCHKKAQDLNTLLQRQIGRIDLSNVETLLGYALALEAWSFPMVVLDVFSYEVALGVGHRWGLTPEEVIDALEEGKIDGYKLDELSRVKRRLFQTPPHGSGAIH